MNRVVIIDSDAAACTVAGAALQAAGYETATAADGQTGLQLVREKKPCIVLLELLLPKLHGFAVCQELRNDAETRRATRVVVISRKSYPADIKKALELGALDFLVKPVGAEQVVAAVKKASQRVPVPQNEVRRLAALEGYKILDTEPEQMFDDLTMLASYICQAPVALISLVDADRQWFKSKVGTDLCQTSRELAFCAHAILQPDVFVVPDAQKDERFRNNMLVTLDPKIRFYAGVPILASSGEAVGTLCVIDVKPRELTKDQALCLKALGRQARFLLEVRQKLGALVHQLEGLPN